MNLIVIPAHNEEATIKTTLVSLDKWARGYFSFEQYHIVVINDASTDKTLDICNELADKKLTVLNNMFDQGKGSALKTAFVISGILFNLYEYDNIIFIDGDGQINPNEILTLFNIMNLYNADAVIGNKRHKYSMTEYTTTRRIISQTYNYMIRLLFDLKLEDTQCGIKIFKKHVLEKVIGKVNVKQYAFDLELLVALRAIRCRIADAPVTIKPQINRGSISLKAILRTFIDTVIIWIKLKRKHYAMS